MGKFQKPHIDRPGVLDPIPGDPEGYVTNEVHFWKSNGYFEHFLVERIKQILAGA